MIKGIFNDKGNYFYLLIVATTLSEVALLNHQNINFTLFLLMLSLKQFIFSVFY